MNKNNEISLFEFKSYLLNNGLKLISDDDLLVFMQKFDQNKNNSFSLKEFFDYLGFEKQHLR